MIKLFLKNNSIIIKHHPCICILFVFISLLLYIGPSIIISLIDYATLNTKLIINISYEHIIMFLPMNLSYATFISCPKYMFIAPTNFKFRKKYVITSLIFKVSSIFIVNIIVYLTIMKSNDFSYLNTIFYILFLLIHIISFNLSLGGYNVLRYKEINYCTTNKLKHAKYYMLKMRLFIISIISMIMCSSSPNFHSLNNICIYFYLLILILITLLLIKYIKKDFKLFIKQTTTYDILFFNLN